MTDIIQTISNAKRLGIKITAAELGTELCAAWADRVDLAAAQFARGDMVACQESIDSANQYAI